MCMRTLYPSHLQEQRTLARNPVRYLYGKQTPIEPYMTFVNRFNGLDRHYPKSTDVERTFWYDNTHVCM
jgi:hypothetical protein